MAYEHFCPVGDSPPGHVPAPFFGSSALRDGTDPAAMAPLGMTLPWSASSELPLPADSTTAAAHFHSALSSLVSSPAHGVAEDEDAAISDLIGRLGTICSTAASANNSCYSTPLSSSPSLEAGRLSRVASSMSLSSSAARKRKAASGEQGKWAAATNGSSKWSRDAAAAEEVEGVEEKPEPGKDYIHVRARRGQATDNHSLAERVRREKISERMKLLQSLVPGCDKITGKALMLDEIINYVQSLQRQVEFLSMKLSTMDDDDAQPYLTHHHKDAVHPATTMESCTTGSSTGFGDWDSVVHHPAAAAGHGFHAGGQQQTAREEATTVHHHMT